MTLFPAVNLIDELLAEQQSLTAVERFAQAHADASTPLLESSYRDLIPLSKPAEGEQYAFEVDLDFCSGCKACVAACHSLNGLDEGESWRDVGTLVSNDHNRGAQITVTSACHHCLDPACANGCPTLAYEKDAETGIVRHLDDQCIGCQYCTMTCPYDVPKYNERLGIVRKCDMCQGRLRAGEAPACVQACPNEAIRIRIVPVTGVKVAAAGPDPLVPGTAPSSITLPSTHYTTKNTLDSSNWRPADSHDLAPAHAHTPLAVMLVATQAGAGLLLFDGIARFTSVVPTPPLWHALLGTVLAIAGIAAATLHLGRPLQAWRAFLGWKRSWLSREILVFGAWAGAAATYAALLAGAPIRPSWAVPVAGAAAIALGLLGVFSSVMVYAVTRRPFWSFPRTGLRFLGTLSGCGAVFTVPLLSAAIFLVLFVCETSLRREKGPFPDSAKVLKGPLRSVVRRHLLLGCAGLACLLCSLQAPSFGNVAFALLIASELIGRSLFFRAVREPRMPGNVPSR